MPKKQKYTKSSVKTALDAVQKGTPLRTASKMFGIPRSTLYDKHKNGVPIITTKGPPTILTPQEENRLVKWIFHVSEKGFPINKDQLCDSVARLVTELNRETPFRDNRPGRHWYEAFLRRHPELCQRIAQNLSYNRTSPTEGKLRNWFNKVESYLSSKNLLNIDPSRIYNCDESAFFLYPKADNVIARKGSRSVYKVVSGDERECLTVLFTINAAGIMAPPMVMFWYKKIPVNVARNIPTDWSIGTSEKGWMTAEIFFKYIANVFYPWLQKNNIEFPVVLYIDGHSSHCTMSLMKFCEEHQIELVALYPNATNILQPLDVAVFNPLKKSWKEIVNNWRLENNAMRISKDMFAPLLKIAIDSMGLTQTIKQGFESCGLSPLSANAVDFNVLKKELKGRTTEVDHELEQRQEAEYAEHLQFIEQHLPADLLSVFNESARIGDWSGETKNEGLFEFWLKIKRLSGTTKQNDLVEAV